MKKSGWNTLVWTAAALVSIWGFVAASAMAAEPKPAGGQALATDTELVETRTEVPRLKSAADYKFRDNTVEIELSQYAGYSGLIVANGGMEPNANSIFTKKYGFKVRLTLSESESWSSLNSGKLAASATTADVLAVYGGQFEVVVPALIGYSRGADGLVVQNDVKRVNDLKGKTLATCQFTEADFFLRYLAQEAGLEMNLLADLAAKPDPERINMVYCADGFGAGDLFLRDLKAGRNRLTGCVTWAPKIGEVADGSAGKARILVTNRNLLIVADILVVNRGFARSHPEIMQGLVAGLMEGNEMVRSNPEAHLAMIRQAFKWEEKQAREELGKVHLANLPENLAFFGNTIDSAGSYGYIYESAVAAYGRKLVPNPTAGERFVNLDYLKALEKSGQFKDQRIAVSPIKSINLPAEREPILSKNIHFLFEPNTSKLDLANQDNIRSLEGIARQMQASPGSMLLLRGHADPGLIEKYRKDGGDALVRQVALTAVSLSKDRAAAIANLLTEKHNVDPARVNTVGRGWEEPLGKDPDKNRRVEVQWFTVE